MYRSPVDDSLMVVGRSVVVVSRETRERERARRDRKEYREQGGSSRDSGKGSVPNLLLPMQGSSPAHRASAMP
jgi:hypothetical protein